MTGLKIGYSWQKNWLYCDEICSLLPNNEVICGEKLTFVQNTIGKNGSGSNWENFSVCPWAIRVDVIKARSFFVPSSDHGTHGQTITLKKMTNNDNKNYIIVHYLDRYLGIENLDISAYVIYKSALVQWPFIEKRIHTLTYESIFKDLRFWVRGTLLSIKSNQTLIHGLKETSKYEIAS